MSNATVLQAQKSRHRRSTGRRTLVRVKLKAVFLGLVYGQASKAMQNEDFQAIRAADFSLVCICKVLKRPIFLSLEFGRNALGRLLGLCVPTDLGRQI